MKKIVATLMLSGLVASLMSAPATAKKKKKPTVRTMEVAYSPSLAIGGIGGSCPGGHCPDIATGTDEYFAMFFLKDDVSSNGYVELTYDADGNGFQGDGEGPRICGEGTPEPVPIEPGVSYTAWPYVAGIGCPGGSSTSGTITVLFSSDPNALKAAAAKL